MLTLPLELKAAVIMYLTPHDLLNVTGVSLDLRNLTIPVLWRTINDRDIWVKNMLEYMLVEVVEGVEAIKAS